MLGRLSSNIYNLRQRRQWTQEHAASEAGLALRPYQHLEAGEGNPTLATVERLATAFKVDPVSLLLPTVQIAARSRGRPPLHPKGESGPLENRKLLLVAPKRNLANQLASDLAALGYESASAQTGRGALDIIEKQRFSVIISNDLLPDSLGAEIFNRAHKAGWLESTTAILLTNSSKKFPSPIIPTPKPLDLEALYKILSSVRGRPTASQKTRAKHAIAFTLFVTGGSALSARTIKNVKNALAAFDPRDWNLTVHDLDQSPAPVGEEILFTPALVKTTPGGHDTLLGDLSDPKPLERLMLEAGARKAR